MDKDNIVQFPEREYEEEDVHKCDSCTSYAIHRLTHNFESEDEEEIVESYLDKMFSALEEGDSEGFIDAVIELYQHGYDNGSKAVLKNELSRMSALLHVMCSEVDGEEQ